MADQMPIDIALADGNPLMQNVEAIAGASHRNESLHFGVADYAASTRARTTNIGGANPDYAVLTDKLEDGSRATHWGDMIGNPHFTIGFWAKTQPARDQATLQHFIDGYRKAGLPE